MAFEDTFKALADPVRRKVLTLLKSGPMSAGEIGEYFDMTGATMSYHLKILREAGLITEEKKKNYIYYQLNTSVVEDMMLWLSDLRNGGEKNEGI